jgi:hypothetical protein
MEVVVKTLGACRYMVLRSCFEGGKEGRKEGKKSNNGWAVREG